MKELNELWNELQATDAPKEVDWSLPNAAHLSASEQIMARLKKKLTRYLRWNQLLSGIAFGLALPNYPNTWFCVSLVVIGLVLALFSFNTYRLIKNLQSQSLDFTTNLKSTAEQLLQLIQQHLDAEVKINQVLTPFGVLLGVVAVLSFRQIPLETIWQNQRLLFTIIGATIGVVLLNFLIARPLARKKYQRQIIDLEELIQRIQEK